MILSLNEIYYAEIQRLNLNNVRENTFARTPDRKYLSSRTRAWKNKFFYLIQKCNLSLNSESLMFETIVKTVSGKMKFICHLMFLTY